MAKLTDFMDQEDAERVRYLARLFNTPADGVVVHKGLIKLGEGYDGISKGE